MLSGIPCYQLMEQWDEAFERDMPEYLARYLIQTCVVRVLQLVDVQDSQAMTLVQHFRALDLDEATFLVRTLLI